MNIILEDGRETALQNKYILLELDTFVVKGEPIKTFCVIDPESLSITEKSDVRHWQKLHGDLIKNYYRKHWNFCEQMIEHLQTRWSGQVNSFYENLYSRIQENKQQDLPDDWTGYIERN